MKIAIISDIHDHIGNLDKALRLIHQHRCGYLLALGDYCAPFTVMRLTEVNLPTSAVFGNNDGDQAGIILSSSNKIDFSPLNQEFKEVKLAGGKIAFCHYPKLAYLIAKSGDYDVVFYGHTHIKDLQDINNTILCNPGAICGIVAGKVAKASFAIFETDNKQLEFIDFDG